MARSDYQARCENKWLKWSTIRSDIELTELKNIYDNLLILERTSQQEQKNVDSIFLTKSWYLDMDFGISMAITSVLSFLIAFIMRFFKNS